MAGQQSIIIPVSDKVEVRRYAPDSIKFADAKVATFDELKVVTRFERWEIVPRMVLPLPPKKL